VVEGEVVPRQGLSAFLATPASRCIPEQTALFGAETALRILLGKKTLQQSSEYRLARFALVVLVGRLQNGLQILAIEVLRWFDDFELLLLLS